MLHNAMGGIWISEEQCYEGAQSKVIREAPDGCVEIPQNNKIHSLVEVMAHEY